MRFNIFSLWEKIYKIVVYTIVALTTLEQIRYYFIIEDKSDTFIVSTLYATFLFVVGIYLAYMDKKIADKLYERRDYYLMLSRIRSFFHDEMGFLSDDETRRKIIAFQVLSGRSENQSRDKKKRAVLQSVCVEDLMENQGNAEDKCQYYIRQEGFVFTKKLSDLENEYLRLSGNLQRSIQESVNLYIKENDIKLTILGFQELSLLDTDYEEWCEKYVVEQSKREEMKQYIYSVIEGKRLEIDELDIKRKQLAKYYYECRNKVISNIIRIENTYGNELHYLIDSNNRVLDTLDYICRRLDEIENRQATYSQVDSLASEIKQCDCEVMELRTYLEEVGADILASIDMIQN